MVDPQQDWIEKYRAALDQQPRRRMSLFAPFQRVGKAFAFGLGRAFGRSPSASQIGAPDGRPPEREQPRADVYANQRTSREKSPLLESHQDKKAS